MKPTWRDDLGEILPIDVRMQPRKVVKHFYNPTEYWDELVGAKVDDLVTEARAAGWRATAGTDAPVSADSRGAIVLRRHHDVHYGPAYLNALAAETTIWAPQSRLGASRALACAAEGVLIAFDRGARCKVVTAFRPSLPLRSVCPTKSDFALEARRRWRHAVDRSDERIEAEDLADALAGDRGDLASVWRLATAVGRARSALSAVPRGPLAQAEARLEAVDPDTRRALLAGVDESSALDDLADAIVEGDTSETLDRLLVLEDLIAASHALGDNARAERLADEAAVRASCAGPELVGLAAVAEARAAAWSGALSGFWREVGAEVLSNAIRLAPPVRNRRALLAFASTWLRESIESTRAMVASLIAEVAIAQPTLARRAHPSEVVATGHAAPAAALRVFIVDRDHPTGEDVSDLIARDDDRWTLQGWQVEPGDDAVLVVVTGAQDATAARALSDLLASADESHQIDAVALTVAR